MSWHKLPLVAVPARLAAAELSTFSRCNVCQLALPKDVWPVAAHVFFFIPLCVFLPRASVEYMARYCNFKTV